MAFIWTSFSFVFFSAVFVGASAVSSVFILPLLFLSFVFSGLVVIFNGLSYTTFKLASSKYNHTVLFLNKLLRKLADNIPPAVGFEEIQQAKQSPWGIGINFPELNLSARYHNVVAFIARPFEKNSTFSSPSVVKQDQEYDFQVQQLTSPAIQGEDVEIPVVQSTVPQVNEPFDSVLNHELSEEIFDAPTHPQNDDQAIKDSELNNIED